MSWGSYWKDMQFYFLDLEKAFNWFLLLFGGLDGLEKWFVRFVQTIYRNTLSQVWENDSFSDIMAQIGLHKGSMFRG